MHRRVAAATIPQAQDLPAEVLRQFRLVFNAVRTHFQQMEKRVGVGGAQVWALSVIRDSPGIGVGELARKMDIHQSTASNLVRSLVARELIRAGKGTGDRRSVQLHILPEGTQVLRKAPQPFTGVLPQALSSLDEATLQRLKQDLDALLRVLRPNERAAQTLMADQV